MEWLLIVLSWFPDHRPDYYQVASSHSTRADCAEAQRAYVNAHWLEQREFYVRCVASPEFPSVYLIGAPVRERF